MLYNFIWMNENEIEDKSVFEEVEWNGNWR